MISLCLPCPSLECLRPYLVQIYRFVSKTAEEGSLLQACGWTCSKQLLKALWKRDSPQQCEQMNEVFLRTAIATDTSTLRSKCYQASSRFVSGSGTSLFWTAYIFSQSCPCPLNCYFQLCLQLFKTLSIYTMEHNDFSLEIASGGHADIRASKTATDLQWCFTGNMPGLPKFQWGLKVSLPWVSGPISTF